MIAALLLLIQQPQTITFSHPCAHSSVVLDALGEQLGVTMKPSGSVNQDYFLVHLTDVPKQEALDKIAATLNATWNEKDGVTYLGRTHAQELEDAKAERDADTKLVQQWLDKRQIKDEYTTEFAKKLVEAVIPLMKESEGPGMNSYLRMQEYEVHAPTMRLLVRIIKEIGVEKIVDLGDDGRVTYVFDPNAFQRKLPMGPAFQMYEKEHAVHKALFEQGIYGDLAPDIGYYSDLVSPYTGRSFNPQQKTSLICERTEMGLTVTLQIEKGGRARATINANEFQTQYIPEELRKLEGKYEPTPIETEIASKAALLFGGGGAGSATVDQQTAAVLRDPVANEPLSVLGSRWITDTSKALGKNCVALLSDEMYFVPFACIAQGNSSYAYMWSILPQIDKVYDIKLEEIWFTVVPSRRVEVRTDRIDREKWGGLLRAGRPGSPMTLEHTAGFASLSDNEITVIISVLPAVLTGLDVSLDAFTRNGVDALRLFGGLTAAQQKAARNGGTEVPLAGLNARMSRAARRIVFGANSSVTKDKIVVDWESGQYFFGRGVENDPDKLLGQGAPNGSIVRLYVVEREVVYPRPPGPGYRAQGYTPDEYGRQRAFSESRNVGQETDYGFAIVAKADQLIVEFEFPGIGFVYRNLQHDRVPRNAEYKPIKDLPEAVRTEMETSYKATAEMIRKSGGGG